MKVLLKKVETAIYEMAGVRVLREITGQKTQYLYSFPNGLYLSFYTCDEYIYPNIKFGKLNLLEEKECYLFVLEDIDIYLNVLYKKKYIKRKPSKFLDIIKSIEVINEYYNEIICDITFINRVNKLKKKLINYNVKSILNENAEKTINVVKEKYAHTSLKLNINELIKKDKMIDILYEKFGEIGTWLICIIIATFIIIGIRLFTDINLNDITSEVFIILCLLILLIMGLIFYIIKYKKNKE